MATAGHAFAEHVGELELRLWARTLPELFAEAGRALAEVLGGPLLPATGAAVEVRLVAPDRDALLVDWLNELLFLAERDKRIYADIVVEHASERELGARVRGYETVDLRVPVKAATFHGLHVTMNEPEEGGVSASVVLDV